MNTEAQKVLRQQEELARSGHHSLLIVTPAASS